jgi:two-component system OmpR family response regulator
MKELQRITYVEDEPHIREIVQLALEELGGFKLQCCESGMQALDTVPQFHPDLVLLDVMMPEMNGVQTFRSLKQIPEFAETPIIFVTAKAQKHEIQQYRSLGAIEVIPKPFDPVALPSEIRGIWQRNQSMQIN